MRILLELSETPNRVGSPTWNTSAVQIIRTCNIPDVIINKRRYVRLVRIDDCEKVYSYRSTQLFVSGHSIYIGLEDGYHLQGLANRVDDLCLTESDAGLENKLIIIQVMDQLIVRIEMIPVLIINLRTALAQRVRNFHVHINQKTMFHARINNRD